MTDNDGKVMVRVENSEVTDTGPIPDETDRKEDSEQEIPLEEMSTEELIQKIDQMKEASDKHHEMYLRAQAEVENIKRRSKKDKEDLIKYANENLIKDLLSVLDNLELALDHADNENSHPALKEGVELTLKGLKNTLEKSGLAEVKAIGEIFDPNVHQAVSQEEDDKAGEGVIIRELQRGYTLNQRLIRPAMVVVSKGNPDHS
jgi:molecular chaperone GrpE